MDSLLYFGKVRLVDDLLTFIKIQKHFISILPFRSKWNENQWLYKLEWGDLPLYLFSMGLYVLKTSYPLFFRKFSGTKLWLVVVCFSSDLTCCSYFFKLSFSCISLCKFTSNLNLSVSIIFFYIYNLSISSLSSIYIFLILEFYFYRLLAIYSYFFKV
jgi:hypothetical protein